LRQLGYSPLSIAQAFSILKGAGSCGRATRRRELMRNADRSGCYRATTAHALAYERASPTKPSILAVNLKLRRRVKEDLRRRCSPQQILGRLRR
jgi:IS30 family transposase